MSREGPRTSKERVQKPTEGTDPWREWEENLVAGNSPLPASSQLTPEQEHVLRQMTGGGERKVTTVGKNAAGETVVVVDDINKDNGEPTRTISALTPTSREEEASERLGGTKRDAEMYLPPKHRRRIAKKHQPVPGDPESRKVTYDPKTGIATVEEKDASETSTYRIAEAQPNATTGGSNWTGYGQEAATEKQIEEPPVAETQPRSSLMQRLGKVAEKHKEEDEGTHSFDDVSKLPEPTKAEIAQARRDLAFWKAIPRQVREWLMGE